MGHVSEHSLKKGNLVKNKIHTNAQILVPILYTQPANGKLQRQHNSPLKNVFFVAILIVNIFGTLGYAEEEFWSSCIKLSATVIFMIIALVLVLGGGPSTGAYSTYQGAKLWYEPGAFANGFREFDAR